MEGLLKWSRSMAKLQMVDEGDFLVFPLHSTSDGEWVKPGFCGSSDCEACCAWDLEQHSCQASRYWLVFLNEIVGAPCVQRNEIALVLFFISA